MNISYESIAYLFLLQRARSPPVPRLPRNCGRFQEFEPSNEAHRKPSTAMLYRPEPKSPGRLPAVLTGCKTAAKCVQASLRYVSMVRLHCFQLLSASATGVVGEFSGHSFVLLQLAFEEILHETAPAN